MEPLDGEALSSTVDIWERVLAAVPAARITELTAEAIRRKGNGYPITASEVFDLWEKPNRAQRSAQQSQLDRTYHEEIGARTAEEEELPVLQFQDSERKRRAEQRYATDLMTRGVCQCEVPGSLSADGTRFVCARGRCDFRWMNPDMIHVDIARLKSELVSDWGRMPDAKVPAVPQPDAAPPMAVRTTVASFAPRLSEDEILMLLAEYCQFNVECVGRAEALEFGRYIIAQRTVTGLNAPDARTLWPDFRAGQTQAADESAGAVAR